MTRRAWVAVLVAGLLSLLPAARDAAAQVHHLDDLPWYTQADTLGRGGLAITYDQFRNGDTGWRTDRVGLMAHLGIGEHGVFYARVHFMRFDTAGYGVLARWPDLAYPGDEEGEGAVDPTWPFESMIVGFSQPELGLMAPLATGQLGFAVGLPVGRDELYPMSSASLPLWLDWRRPLDPAGPFQGAVRVGVEHTFDSGREYLTADAFPGGFRYGAEAGLRWTSGHELLLDWSARELSDGRHIRRLRLTGLVPLGDRNVLALQLSRDLGGRADRYATWIASVAWRLPSRGADPDEESAGDGLPPGQNATGR
jgi:hypothetical protein